MAGKTPDFSRTFVQKNTLRLRLQADSFNARQIRHRRCGGFRALEQVQMACPERSADVLRDSAGSDKRKKQRKDYMDAQSHHRST